MVKKLSTPGNEKPALDEKTFKLEKYKVNIELIKWFIGSVVLVLVTTIIDKGFKERAAGIQEMQAYDKYVEVILKADNIEERWKLSQYFSIVTPTERLRERWIAYKDSISDDYKNFKDLSDKEYELTRQKNALLRKDSISETDKKLNEIHNKLAPFEKRLTNTTDYGSAQVWEEKGFSYLINRDVANAINAFTSSENTYKQYHQVYEIAMYLSRNKSKLIESNSGFWKTAFKKIATDYSWGMPLDIKTKLLEYSK